MTGKPLAEPLLHKWVVISAQFSPDSRRVVTASLDGTARVWDAQTGRPLTEWLRHEDWVAYAEFSPNGTRVLTASSDGTARIWELASAVVPIPSWFPELAEGVVGQRLADQEVPEPVSPAQFLALKQQLAETSETNHYTAWAKWFLSDRLARGTSLTSRVTGTDHLARLIEWNSVPTLREALHLSPGNADVTARLAREVLAKSPKEYPHKEQVAAFLAERAVKLNPEEPEAWRAKAEVLEHARPRTISQ